MTRRSPSATKPEAFDWCDQAIEEAIKRALHSRRKDIATYLDIKKIDELMEPGGATFQALDPEEIRNLSGIAYRRVRSQRLQPREPRAQVDVVIQELTDVLIRYRALLTNPKPTKIGPIRSALQDLAKLAESDPDGLVERIWNEHPSVIKEIGKHYPHGKLNFEGAERYSPPDIAYAVKQALKKPLKGSPGRLSDERGDHNALEQIAKDTMWIYLHHTRAKKPRIGRSGRFEGFVAEAVRAVDPEKNKDLPGPRKRNRGQRVQPHAASKISREAKRILDEMKAEA